MRLIDADSLKEDLTRFYDGEVTARQLIDEQPTVEPEQCEWIAKEVDFVPYGLMVECSKCGRLELVDNALYHKYCPNCGRKVITE